MSLIKSPTKVELEGRGLVTLRASDYVAQGGEGAIYLKDKTIIKLYLDPGKMQQDDMVGKIRLLAKTFSHPSIVAPQGIVLNSKGVPIGFYMPEARGEALSRFFTNDFRNQIGFSDTHAKQLVKRMYETVGLVHAGDAHMVDANELNWLALHNAKAGPTVSAIDVDSWAIGHWPAKVIMPSIRDWHSQKFGPMTDWYAWGIVSFQVFTGIHPFKGTLAGYKPGEMERRMKDNASVFAPGVRLNRAVRDFSCIPGPLLEWYQETFTSTTRTKPPLPSLTGPTFGGGKPVMRHVTTQTGGLIYERIFEIAGEEVSSVWPCGVVRTNSGALYALLNKQRIGTSTANRLAVTEHTDGWLLAEESGGTWTFRFIARLGHASTTLQNPCTCQNILRSGNRLFAITEQELVELELHSFAKPIITIGKRWGIMGKSTKWYGGVGVADVLGSTYLIAPFGDKSVAVAKVPELDQVKVVNAIAGTRYTEVIGVGTNGAYTAYGFAFDKDWQTYSLTKRTVDQPELNTTILPKGVAARIEEDGELVVFVPSKEEEKVLKDKDLLTTMSLAHVGDKVVYRKDGALWSLRMR